MIILVVLESLEGEGVPVVPGVEVERLPLEGSVQGPVGLSPGVVRRQGGVAATQRRVVRYDCVSFIKVRQIVCMERLRESGLRNYS